MVGRCLHWTGASFRVTHLEENPDFLKCLIEQGITTVVAGNCGFSPAPYKEKNLFQVRAVHAASGAGRIHLGDRRCWMVPRSTWRVSDFLGSFKQKTERQAAITTVRRTCRSLDEEWMPYSDRALRGRDRRFADQERYGHKKRTRYGLDDFCYDKERVQYECPNGKRLSMKEDELAWCLDLLSYLWCTGK